MQIRIFARAHFVIFAALRYRKELEISNRLLDISTILRIITISSSIAEIKFIEEEKERYTVFGVLKKKFGQDGEPEDVDRF